ncbi:hypothetical protein PCCS19_45360 [Paenibacillus sp. CCS19]|nr:hypothetical protein PCCS19_45360 [Paenibacillus cellulosilyticus]
MQKSDLSVSIVTDMMIYTVNIAPITALCSIQTTVVTIVNKTPPLMKKAPVPMMVETEVLA